MYKKIIGAVLVGGVMMMAATGFSADYYDKLTQDEQQVVKTDDIGQNGASVIREGAYNPGKNVELYNQGEITSFADAENQTFAYIRKIVNWILGLLGVIALIYLIYNGIQMMTAAGDDSKYKKGAASARAATIALVGIGTSALIVRTIFWLIGFIITP